MQRYFAYEKKNDLFILSSEDSYHILTVMRMNINDKVEVVYEEKAFICEIVEVIPTVSVKVINEDNFTSELSSCITIVQSLVKEQKMDYILQKCTELGTYSFIPFAASRSVVKMDNSDTKKIIRWQKITKEASEQSKRVVIPEVKDLVSLNELSKIEGYDYKFLCSVNETSQNIKKVLSNVEESATILFVIGPEGGFTENEEKTLIENGFVSISLGNSVLRTETASTFIMSVIRYLDMRC